MVVSVVTNPTLYAKWMMAPTVATATPSVIGSATATARGVCWGTAANPTVADARPDDGAGTGTFSSTLTGLNDGTTYYVRAYAINSVGTAYGEPQPFTTPEATGPDFVITGISITPELPAVGGKLTATVTVLNQGGKSGKAGNLYVWVDKAGMAAVGEKCVYDTGGLGSIANDVSW